ncbi:hypothetical protein CDAR_32391 [Caerostris darwini]|uniref:Uncharacterized protein n=1 Tax=Caerostris darwini TaxID=1538125 RepID=A0AAV4WMQ5_9ARAC|nr:hypothetical protein CDAR_32391 [Caerostris darwini]
MDATRHDSLIEARALFFWGRSVMDINRSRLIQFPATDHSHDPKHLPGKNERNGNPTSGRNHPQMGPQPDGQEPSSVPSSLCRLKKKARERARGGDYEKAEKSWLRGSFPHVTVPCHEVGEGRKKILKCSKWRRYLEETAAEECSWDRRMAA